MDRARLGAKAGLKTIERQAEDQRQKLHITKIELATQKQLVLELKADLQKAKKEARMAKEDSGAAEMVAFKRAILEIDMRLQRRWKGSVGNIALRFGQNHLTKHESLLTSS